MEYGLIENALHSLSEAVSYYNSCDEDYQPDKFKFAILLAAHCAELLMKEALRRVHPAFLLVNVDKFRTENIIDEETIGYKLAIKRLKNICNVDFSFYEEYLNNLGIVRNRLQHFKYTVNGEEHKQLMCNAFSAIDFLMNNVLNIHIEEYRDIISEKEFEILKEDYNRIDSKLRDINKEFSNGVYNRFTFEYNDGKHIKVLCPICGNNTLSYNRESDVISCHFCDKRYNGISEMHSMDYSRITADSLLREIGRRKKDLDFLVYECPDCNDDSIIKLDDNRWMCILCGKEYNDSTCCDECGSEMPNSSKVYYNAIPDINPDNYLMLCPSCASKARGDMRFIGYEITHL